jgi:hypothetical protein
LTRFRALHMCIHPPQPTPPPPPPPPLPLAATATKCCKKSSSSSRCHKSSFVACLLHGHVGVKGRVILWRCLPPLPCRLGKCKRGGGGGEGEGRGRGGEEKGEKEDEEEKKKEEEEEEEEDEEDEEEEFGPFIYILSMYSSVGVKCRVILWSCLPFLPCICPGKGKKRPSCSHLYVKSEESFVYECSPLALDLSSAFHKCWSYPNSLAALRYIMYVSILKIQSVCPVSEDF